MIGQSLVAFQLLIDQEDSLPELVSVESGRNPPQALSALASGSRSHCFQKRRGGEFGPKR